MEEDIRLRIGNSVDKKFSADKFDLEKNEDLRLNLVVVGGDDKNYTVPWKLCDKQTSPLINKSDDVKFYCPDMLANKPIAT
jgi:hypothetical protein